MIVLPQTSASEIFGSTAPGPVASAPAAMPGTAVAGTGQNAGDFSEHMSQALSGFPVGANSPAPAQASPAATPDLPDPPDSIRNAVTGSRSGAHSRTATNPSVGKRALRPATAISGQPVTATSVSGGKPAQGTRQKPSRERDSRDAVPTDPPPAPPGFVPIPQVATPQPVPIALQPAQVSKVGAPASSDVSDDLTAGHHALPRDAAPPVTAPRDTVLSPQSAGQGAGEGARATPGPGFEGGSQSATAPTSEANGQPQAAGPPGGRFPADTLQSAAAPDSPAIANPPVTGANVAVAPDGTTAALGNQRMKSAAEKNKIAGSTLQNLPSATTGGDTSVEAGGKLQGQGMPRPSARKQGDAELQPVINFEGKSATAQADVPQVHSGQGVQAPDRTAQLERTAELVTREVVMVKQSGISSLAVSLKPDPHTELFLQLTNHDGQLQASLRCERGDVSGLASQWGQLQESLARHNVQLLPLEDRSGQRPHNFVPQHAPLAGRDFNQQPSSQNPQHQSRELPVEAPIAARSPKPGAAQKTANKTSARQGWESWA
jgi:hypothetical protein